MSFNHQEKDFTIRTDKMNWILIWHPGGPRYSGPDENPTLLGHRSYYAGLDRLLAGLLNKRCFETSGFDDLRTSLPRFKSEIRRLADIHSAAGEEGGDDED